MDVEESAGYQDGKKRRCELATFSTAAVIIGDDAGKDAGG